MQRVGTEDGLYKVGAPTMGVKGTRATDFFNDVQEEICNVIEAAGIVLDGSQRNQLLAAITAHTLGATFTDIGGSGKKCRLAFEWIGEDGDGNDIWALVPQTVLE